MVSFTMIILLGGGALFLLAGGGKFISPAITKTKGFITTGKGLIDQTTSNINSKSESVN